MSGSIAATALAPRSTRSRLWTAEVEAHHAAFRSSSHSSMKAENWFQLRIVGVTKDKAILTPVGVALLCVPVTILPTARPSRS